MLVDCVRKLWGLDYESGWMPGLVHLVIGWRSMGFPVELGSLVMRKGFDVGGFKTLADGVLMWFFFFSFFFWVC